MECIVCGRPLTSITSKMNKMGPVCSKKHKRDADTKAEKIYCRFLSKRTDGARHFFVLVNDQKFNVVIRGPHSDGKGCSAMCSCGATFQCKHALAAADLDRKHDHFLHVMAYGE